MHIAGHTESIELRSELRSDIGAGDLGVKRCFLVLALSLPARPWFIPVPPLQSLTPPLRDTLVLGFYSFDVCLSF